MNQVIHRLRTTRALDALMAGVTLLVMFGIYSAVAGSGDDKPPATVPVARGTVVSTVSADGNLSPPQDLSLGFERGGRLVAIPVREGDRVRRGQVLARVRDGAQRAQLRSAERSLASAIARLQDTRAGRTVAELSENQRLADQSRVAVRNARSELAKARNVATRNVEGLRRAVGRARVGGEEADLRTSELRLNQERAEVITLQGRYDDQRNLLDGLDDELDALQDSQRNAENDAQDAGGDVRLKEVRLNSARLELQAAESDLRLAQAERAEACVVPASPECTEAMQEEDQAEQDVQDAQREVDDAEDDFRKAQRDETDTIQDANDVEFQIRALETRIADAERDESTSKSDLDTAEANVRSYIQDVEGDRIALRDARRREGTAQDDLRNGLATASQQVDAAQRSLRSSEAQLGVTLANNRVDEQGPEAAELAADRANVTQAESTVQDARESLEDTVLRAPVDGVVGKVDAEVGEVVGTSGSLGSASLGGGGEDDGGGGSNGGPTPSNRSGSRSTGSGGGEVIRLAQVDALQVKADFNETDAAKLRRNDTATISVDALPSTRFSARVANIDPVETIKDNVVTYEVTLLLDGAQGGLRPGMTATADVIAAEADGVLTLPRSAVRTPSGAKPTVVVVNPDGEEEARLVVTGLEGDTEVEIVGGVGLGDRVARTATPAAQEER